MIKKNSQMSVIIFALSMCFGAVLFFSSCASNESKAKKVIQEHLKNQGITDLAIDSFFTSPSVPEKAYASATVTYNFASSDGRPQKEFLGFILAKEGNGWRIERNAGYTKDQEQALKFMQGLK